MSSRQAVKDERAEAAAKVAASELRDVNRDREYQEGAKTTAEQREQHRTALLGTLQGGTDVILKAVQSTLEHAKEAAIGKPHDASYTSSEGAYVEAVDSDVGKAREATDKMGQYKDQTADKAKQTKDSTAEKMGEDKDYAADKAKQTKDSTAEKMGEYKDYTADKAKQTKDSTVEKVGEYKDYEADRGQQTLVR